MNNNRRFKLNLTVAENIIPVENFVKYPVFKKHKKLQGNVKIDKRYSEMDIKRTQWKI